MDPDPSGLRGCQRAIGVWAQGEGVGYWPVLANLARLAEEVGELARLVLVHEGIKAPLPGLADRLTEEAGDVLFTTLLLTNQLGIDAADAVAGALARARRRGPPRGPAS